MTRTGQFAVLVVTTLACGLLVAGCGNGVRAEGDASPAPSSPASPAPTSAAEMQKLVDDAASAAAAADSDAAADR
ncbi:hypothetical protein BX264_6896 [Streptomyces sp. 2333.5]|uniref:hypothetical protein n=1 Tax=Streptomyces TaxID=1883 RepID=UPI000899B1A3|nr:MULTISPECIES: hypothetical protein [Streptomyces]MCF3172710.1 hypothetical protein [Streptomyces sioyaensis]PJJ06390.1 hypothetical protein BX264_6896 [Streptomyces sp. 2333.5]SEE94716.1 hypothetical protein SAMN05428943_6998 [Streptomyces sp. 2314.4]SEF09454.1 hypothetical protein SAMN05428942_6997 [Streptomyces sp. 2112.2]